MDKLGGLANCPAEWLAERTFSSVRSARRWRRIGCAPRLVVTYLKLLLDGPLGAISGAWHGWHIYRDKLVSPEGHEFTADEVRAIPLRLQQISALERSAREFAKQQDEREAESDDRPPRQPLRGDTPGSGRDRFYALVRDAVHTAICEENVARAGRVLAELSDVRASSTASCASTDPALPTVPRIAPATIASYAEQTIGP